MTMTHDPMCDGSALVPRWGWHCHCDLIRRVREDEVEQASVVIANMTTEIGEAYRRGVEDAAQAVEALSIESTTPSGVERWISAETHEVVAAARGES